MMRASTSVVQTTNASDKYCRRNAGPEFGLGKQQRRPNDGGDRDRREHKQKADGGDAIADSIAFVFETRIDATQEEADASRAARAASLMRSASDAAGNERVQKKIGD
jgi:hypothetical protein